MRNKLITAAAFSLLLATGAAYAQDNGGEAAVQPPLPGLETFHTDASMTHLRTPDEMRASFDALSAEERQALRDRCEMSTAAATTNGVDNQTTASIEENGMPATFADLCVQVGAWQ